MQTPFKMFVSDRRQIVWEIQDTYLYDFVNGKMIMENNSTQQVGSQNVVSEEGQLTIKELFLLVLVNGGGLFYHSSFV